VLGSILGATGSGAATGGIDGDVSVGVGDSGEQAARINTGRNETAQIAWRDISESPWILLRRRTLLYVRLSSLTYVPGFKKNGEVESGWKA
jgi:hypothetical protein